MFTAKFLVIVFATFVAIDVVLLTNQVSFVKQLKAEQDYSSTSFNSLNRRINSLVPTATLTPAPTATPAAVLKRVITPVKK